MNTTFELASGSPGSYPSNFVNNFFGELEEDDLEDYLTREVSSESESDLTEMQFH